MIRLENNIAFLISMFNEFNIVQRTVDAIKAIYQSPTIHIVQSDDGSKKIIHGVDSFTVLENLMPLINKHKVPSHTIARNYSHLFSTVYAKEYQIIVALTGDTLLTDPTTVLRIYDRMKLTNKVLACAQALYQDFHAAESDPENDVCGGRYQHENSTDFMPQFFIVDGSFTQKTKVFSNIEIHNEYTSEQNLGDEFKRHFPDESFSSHALVIAKNAYEYSDGIVYNMKGPQ